MPAFGSSVGPTVYRGDSAPTTGRLGDLWVNTASGFPIVSICTSISPLTWTPLGGSMKPLSTTSYTTGSGNYSCAVGDWLRVTLVGGGGGGGGVQSGTTDRFANGGSGAETCIFWLRAPLDTLPYSVGGGGGGGSTSGGSGAAGGQSYFFGTAVEGGRGGGGDATTAPPYGGGYQIFIAGYASNSGGDTTIFAPYWNFGGERTPGGSGGGRAGTTQPAKYAGFPDYAEPTVTAGTYDAGGATSGGAGGCSVFGRGGASRSTDGAGNVGTGYGAGGGGARQVGGTAYAGGAGTGGLIIVDNYGNW